MIPNRITSGQLYDLILTRNTRYDDSFFFAVTSTGIYCRPSCPARRPLKKNCRFFTFAREAEELGFRACKRCRPNELNVGTKILQFYKAPQHSPANTEYAKSATGLSVGERQFRRLVKNNIGRTPTQLFQQQRLEYARNLLRCTDLPIVDIAFKAEFSSVRQFNYAFRQRYGVSPRQSRRSKQNDNTNVL